MHLTRTEWIQASRSHLNQTHRRGSLWKNLEAAIYRAEELTDEQWEAGAKELFEPEVWDGTPPQGTYSCPDRGLEFWKDFDRRIQEVIDRGCPAQA